MAPASRAACATAFGAGRLFLQLGVGGRWLEVAPANTGRLSGGGQRSCVAVCCTKGPDQFCIKPKHFLVVSGRGTFTPAGTHPECNALHVPVLSRGLHVSTVGEHHCMRN
jgi:hypothetical protein